MHSLQVSPTVVPHAMQVADIDETRFCVVDVNDTVLQNRASYLLAWEFGGADIQVRDAFDFPCDHLLLSRFGGFTGCSPTIYDVVQTPAFPVGHTMRAAIGNAAKVAEKITTTESRRLSWNCRSTGEVWRRRLR